MGNIELVGPFELFGDFYVFVALVFAELLLYFCLEPGLEAVGPAQLCGLGEREVAGEVEGFELVVGEEQRQRLFEEVDALEQEEHVQLLQHLLPRLVVELRPLPGRPEI